MLNSTVLSLNVLSAISMSPFYVMQQMHNGLIQSSFYNSRFSSFFSNTIRVYSAQHKTSIMGCSFMRFLNTPLVFDSYDCAIETNNNQPFLNSKFDGNKVDHSHAIFFQCNNYISIHFSIFSNCRSGGNEPGGTIYIRQDCSVSLFGLQITESGTANSRGGAISATKNEPKSGDYPEDDPITKFDARYICFRNCFPLSADNLYGVAIFSSAKDTVIYFVSTVDCPHNNNLNYAKGAQIDLSCDNCVTRNINITGGKARYCGGLEYRKAKTGSFNYNTITNINECSFANSYNNIDELNIRYANFVNNKLKKDDGIGNANPALIHVMYKSIKLHHFYFVNFKDSDAGDAKLVSRAADDTSQAVEIQLINCFHDKTVQEKHYNNRIVLKNFVFESDLKTAEILGFKNDTVCEGAVTVPNKVDTPVVQDTPTPTFTPSNCFSATKDFSISSDFTISDQFTSSGKFTKTKPFSQTTQFTLTTDFTKSSLFTLSNGFTSSSIFTPSYKFDQSHYFTPSKTFTASSKFSSSGKFSGSEDFSKSDKFTKSFLFSESTEFTKSSSFSESALYILKESSITNSNVFEKTQVFSESRFFTENHINIIVRGDESNQDVKMSPGKIAGIAITAAILAALVILGVLLIYKKRKINDFSAEIIEQESIADDIHYDNPLYKNGVINDDPFAQDFDEDGNNEMIIL